MEEKRKEKEENNAGQDWVRIAGVTDRYWLGLLEALNLRVVGVPHFITITGADDEVQIAQVPLLLLPLDLACQHQHVRREPYSIV